MKKFNGFTLAEVLITLGIIGVVAAMTMPTLINQTNGAQYKAAYKKALSAISQAVTLNVALDDKSFADVSTTTASTAADAATADTIVGILKSRMNVVSNTAPTGYSISAISAKSEIACDEEDDDDCTDGKKTATETITPSIYIFFNDSSMFALQAGTKNCTKDVPCYGVIDVNGAKGPNKPVDCDAVAESATDKTCKVTSPTDIYPVVFYDQTILPASDAARAVLYGK